MTRRRLDDELVRRGFYASRARARDAVLRGTVQVNGAAALKPAQGVDEGHVLTVSDEARAYVSRAALKLAFALDHFGIPVQGMRALDIGSSTGGFTQVLLKAGAVHVTAIDVGHGQMDPAIAKDPRVRLIEGLNARYLNAAHIAGAIDLLVCDVSFISLTLALPPALGLAGPGARLVALLKPQFEAGRGANPHDEAQQKLVCERIRIFLEEQGWPVFGFAQSPISGGDGMTEFLIAAVKA